MMYNRLTIYSAILAVAAFSTVSCENFDDSSWLARGAAPTFNGNVECSVTKIDVSKSSIDAHLEILVNFTSTRQSVQSANFLVSQKEDMSGGVQNYSATINKNTLSADVTLEPGKTYYMQAEISREAKTDTPIVSEVSRIAFGNPAPPVISGFSVTEPGYQTARVRIGTIDDYNYGITEMGILFSCDESKLSLTSNPLPEKHYTPIDKTLDTRCNLTSATKGTSLDMKNSPTYYLRAYATNAFGTGYSSIASISTVEWPSKVSGSFSAATASSVTYNYEVKQATGDKITLNEFVCWNASNDFDKAQSASGHTLTGLEAGKYYYVWAMVKSQYDETIYWLPSEGYQFTGN